MKYLIPIIFGVSLFFWSLPIQSKYSMIKEVIVEVPVYNDRTVPFDTLFKYVSIIESENDPTIVGDGGMSWGIAQIQQGAITDVNRYWKTNYVHDDAFDVKKSRKIFQLYLTYIMHTQGVKTTQELVRCWNGGPTGYQKRSTVDYWYKYKNAAGLE